MLRTRLCDLLGIDVPILAAPMGPDISSPELAAAVSNAGGLGLVSFGVYPPPLLRQLIRRMRELTDRPFGVNFILALAQPEQVERCIEERVPSLSFAWGDPTPYIERAHAAGIRVLDQVGSVAEARRSAAAGADVIIAQGFEAGGHVAGTVTTMALVPRVVDAVAPVPVVAAGGIADARGLVAALALGAEGVSLGTRFLATPEANAHPTYKRRVVEATEEQTVHTRLFGGGWPGAPVRTLRTAFVERWLPQEGRGQEQRPDEPVIGQTRLGGQVIPVQRFSSLPPGGEAAGEIESMDLLAGQGVGLVHEIKPAAEVVRELVEGARRIIEMRLAGVAGRDRT
jgi:NAD(P)H-dependent flavin oxidoreductase YrpB (nitropropane dioxygenase family)